MNASNFSDNKELQMAFDYVMNTNKSVFLTGKAGTGKTTFLRQLKQLTPKRLAVVAPTGVAAMNAGGMTIHSLFQLPFTPFIPNIGLEAKRFSREKISLIKSLDLLIIDEISMVRCDVLDAIDAVCRMYRDKRKPFGGIQLLMIGDIIQLSPVSKEDEWNLLRPYYKNIYFFSSLALQEEFPITIELKHIYRQSDQNFIDLLNKVRDNKLDDDAVKLLNSRKIPGFDMRKNPGYITLTTHNNVAKRINQQMLDSLESVSQTFTAEIKNDFPEYIYPTEKELELKVGAQVMFIKNDSSKSKQYYNGKIGTIISMKDDLLIIETDEIQRIFVSKEEWQNIKYTLNTETKVLEEKIIGTFSQFPVKLAWAITIHKSQGLTFDKVIIDAESSFSSGQVYVALSRCRSLEGIVLISQIHQRSIIESTEVTGFNNKVSQQELTEQQLFKAKKDFQDAIINDLLDSKKIKDALFQLMRFFKDHSSSVPDKLIYQLEDFIKKSDTEIFNNFDKFYIQIKSLYTENELPESNEQVIERLKKASEYFTSKLMSILFEPLKEFVLTTDNKVILEGFQKALNQARFSVYEKYKLFTVCHHQFNTVKIIQAKANAWIEFEKEHQKNQVVARPVPGVHHPELYAKLTSLRNDLSAEYNLDVYRILQIKTMMEIANTLPTQRQSLAAVKGVGNFVMSKFADEIIQLVAEYCSEKNISETDLYHQEEAPLKIKKTPKSKPLKDDTKKISYELYKSGKTISEIAQSRELTEQTIEGHLSYYMSLGEIPVTTFLTQKKIDILHSIIGDEEIASLTEWKLKLPDDISYSDIRHFKMYREYLRSKSEVEG